MNSRMAMITFFDGAPSGERPDQGLPSGPPGHPSQGLPGSPVYPSNELPADGNSPVQLPVFPFDPSQGPSEPPPTTRPIRPGARFILKWNACYGWILVPDQSLPPGEAAQPK